MDMSDMSSLMGSGMDMSSDPMFRTYNQVLARGYWYIIAFVVGIFLLLRAMEYYQTWSRLKRSRTRNVKYPTRPSNFVEQAYATGTAILREISYPQVLLKNRWFAWLSPPPLGRVLFLACYWAIVLYMMTNKAVISDAYYYERLGFRNAWISVTQVPLVYLLASKSSIVGCIVGSSHERLNWLHRWVSRTLLLTVTVHGGFFLREWVRADFVQLELEMMPMVKYGIGAWAILVWTFITSLSPLRSLAYEIFVLQHIAAAAVFLWLLWAHVPSYANYNVWFAISAISFDWVLRLLLAVYRNVRIRVRRRNCCNSTKFIGHQINLRAVGNDLTVVTIKDVHMPWKAGQHLYLWVPRLGLLESHPFTIATPCKSSKGCHCNEIQLAIKTQAGFSRKINRFAVMTQGTSKSLTGFIAGPYGVPPKWEAYETLILISASTGASFTLPILESILDNPASICTRRIKLLLVVRARGHIDYYAKRILNALARTEAMGISLDVEIAVTGAEETKPLLVSEGILYSYGRPDIASFIRRPVEITGGETSVAVCGGKSLVATVRNSVASLSDERAVHKGSGAQGIHLHVEEYCF